MAITPCNATVRRKDVCADCSASKGDFMSAPQSVFVVFPSGNGSTLLSDHESDVEVQKHAQPERLYKSITQSCSL